MNCRLSFAVLPLSDLRILSFLLIASLLLLHVVAVLHLHVAAAQFWSLLLLCFLPMPLLLSLHVVAVRSLHVFVVLPSESLLPFLSDLQFVSHAPLLQLLHVVVVCKPAGAGVKFDGKGRLPLRLAPLSVQPTLGSWSARPSLGSSNGGTTWARYRRPAQLHRRGAA